jgi:hypothetical protein
VNYPLDFSKPLLKADEGTTFIFQLNPEVQFLKVQSLCFELNLRIIESKLPELLAFMLYHQYQTGTSKIADLLEVAKQANPIGYDLESGLPFYENRMIRFFTALLSEMATNAIWLGDDYMAFYLKDARDFLLNNTQLEIMFVEEDNGFLKLNLQVSFIPGTSLKM